MKYLGFDISKTEFKWGKKKFEYVATDIYSAFDPVKLTSYTLDGIKLRIRTYWRVGYREDQLFIPKKIRRYIGYNNLVRGK